MFILLDIDGVLIPAKGWKTPDLLEDGFPAFSQQAVRVLQALAADGHQFVLTSSHRLNFSLSAWCAIFQHRGININQITRLPAYPELGSRKIEIMHWLITQQELTDFIIIDDDKSLNDLSPTLKKQLVLTSPYIGLTMAHLTEINAIAARHLHPA